MKQEKKDSRPKLIRALWQLYDRPIRPEPWDQGGNLPWDDPDFSIRMLREHLDESHGAASRITSERQKQIDWIWQQLQLGPDHHLLDVTCGPGLYAVEFARRGCFVAGYDFGPASIDYARELAASTNLSNRCTFIQQDVRTMELSPAGFDAAILIYGQLAVMTKREAGDLLASIARGLKPGGRLCVELLNQERVDKENSSWWFTDDKGLWGSTPFMHLGERQWLEDEALSIERYHIIELESGAMNHVTLCDQTYAAAEMVQIMENAGFSKVKVYPAWNGLDLYDADEWIVYVAER